MISSQRWEITSTCCNSLTHLWLSAEWKTLINLIPQPREFINKEKVLSKQFSLFLPVASIRDMQSHRKLPDIHFVCHIRSHVKHRLPPFVCDSVPLFSPEDNLIATNIFMSRLRDRQINKSIGRRLETSASTSISLLPMPIWQWNGEGFVRICTLNG